MSNVQMSNLYPDFASFMIQALKHERPMSRQILGIKAKFWDMLRSNPDFVSFYDSSSGARTGRRSIGGTTWFSIFCHWYQKTYFNTRLSAGAILLVTVPDDNAVGLARTGAKDHPKRSMSYRGAAKWIISMAPQARPKVSGQIDPWWKMLDMVLITLVKPHEYCLII